MEAAQDGWYSCDLDRRLLKQLARRSDAKGLARFGVLIAMTVASGGLAYLSLGTVWVIPAFWLYGTVYAFGEAAAHELNHGTVFRSLWLNRVAHWITCFMAWREPVYSSYRHAKHHSHTSLIGADSEGTATRPRNVFVLASEMLLRWGHARTHIGAMFRHSLGIVSEHDRDFIQIPKSEYRRMFWNARLLLLAYGAIMVWSIAAQSWLPVLFLLVPRAYGTLLHDLCSRTQHDGLAVNVPDHRLTTRTVRLNKVLQFLYWNMNFHIEHHIYPAVPFHALPKLHDAVKDQLPRPSDGLWGAWRDILAAIWRQQWDPDHHIVQTLPEPEPEPAN